MVRCAAWSMVRCALILLAGVALTVLSGIDEAESQALDKNIGESNFILNRQSREVDKNNNEAKADNKIGKVNNHQGKNKPKKQKEKSEKEKKEKEKEMEKNGKPGKRRRHRKKKLKKEKEKEEKQKKEKQKEMEKEMEKEKKKKEKVKKRKQAKRRRQRKKQQNLARRRHRKKKLKNEKEEKEKEKKEKLKEKLKKKKEKEKEKKRKQAKRRRQRKKKQNLARRRQRKKKQNLARQATCNGTSLGDTCLNNLITAMKFERDKVASFMAQKARAESFKKVIGNKGGKDDTFGNTTTFLLLALGGNVSSLNCSGKTSLNSESSIAYKTLANCSTSILAACAVPNNTANFTQLNICNATYQAIMTKNKQCLKITTNGTALCECWAAAANMTGAAKRMNGKCDSKTAQNNIKDLKKSCLGKFGECKNAEDASVSFIMACSQDSGSRKMARILARREL